MDEIVRVLDCFRETCVVRVVSLAAPVYRPTGWPLQRTPPAAASQRSGPAQDAAKSDVPHGLARLGVNSGPL